MNTNADTIRTAWGVSLSQDLERRLLAALGPGHALVGLNAAEIGTKDGRDPDLIFMSLAAWETLDNQGKAALLSKANAERILLLDKPAAPETVADILSHGFATVIPAEAGAERIKAALAKARESATVYDEISSLVGAVLNERKTLTQQRDRLAFLHRILARAAATMDPQRILAGLFADLREHFPVNELLAVLWHDDLPAAAEIYLDKRLGEEDRASRVKYLLAQAAKATGADPGDYLVTRVETLRPEQAAATEEPGKAIRIGLASGGEVFGSLTVVAGGEISRDNRDFLRAAIRQLAPAFANALAYRGLKHRADRDGLTRLQNRRAFDERIGEEIERQRRYGGHLSFLMLDIDYFKRINDTYGHQAGDEALRQVADIIRKTVRASDFAARYGGEEFAVILPGTDAANAWLLAERLRTAVARHHVDHEGRRIAITLSAGVTSSIEHEQLDAAELVRQADTALYAAKAGGRNAVVAYGDSLDETELQLAAQAG